MYFLRNIFFRSGPFVFALLPAFLLPGSPVKAEPDLDIRGDRTVNYFSRYGQARIKLNKVLFGPEEDIPVEFTVRNSGYTTIRIYPGYPAQKSFQFQVTDKKGQELARVVKDSFYRRERGADSVNLVGERVKEIILHPGESFTRRIFLNDFYNLEGGKEYRVVGFFYPDYRNGFFVRTRNMTRVRINMHREKNFYKEVEGHIYANNLPGLSPEETVYLFLSAEMRRNWRNYLKFLDLRKFIFAYDRFASRYARAEARERSLVLRDFERFLIDEPTDRLRRFRITATRYDRTTTGELRAPEMGRSYVEVRAERASKGYRVIYKYTYTLERVRGRDGFWRIIHVTATVVR